MVKEKKNYLRSQLLFLLNIIPSFFNQFNFFKSHLFPLKIVIHFKTNCHFNSPQAKFCDKCEQGSVFFPLDTSKMNEKRRRKKRSNERSQRFISNVRCLSFLLFPFFFFFYRTRNNSWRSGSVQFGRQLSRQMTFVEFIRALISPREWP